MENENQDLSVINESGEVLDQQAIVTANPWVGIIQQSLSSGADVASIEKFIELQREEEDRQAERAFNLALSQLQSGMPQISKSGVAKFKTKTGEMSYNFDSLNDICNALRPLLFEAGLSYSFTQAQEGNQISVKCTIKHKSGHQVSNVLTAPADTTGNKNNIQQIASTVSYLQRYTLKAAFGIASVDDDGAASQQNVSELQGKRDFAKWMATAKAEMDKYVDKDALDAWYNQAINYASQYNKPFVIELEQKYTEINQSKGW